MEEEQNNNKTSNLKQYLYKGTAAFLVIAAGILLFFVLYKIKSIYSLFALIYEILKPVFIGCIIAYILYPLVCLIERGLTRVIGKRMNNRDKSVRICRGISVFLSIIIAASLLTFIIYMIIPDLYTSIVNLIQNIPSQIESTGRWIADKVGDDPTMNSIIDGVSGYITDWLQTDLLSKINVWANYVTTGVVNVVVALKNFIIGLIISVYLLLGKEKFFSGARRVLYAAFPRGVTDNIIRTVRTSHKIFSGFLVGKIIDSLIIGVLCFIGMTIMGLPYSLLISVFVGITNVIPYFGPFIGAIPSAILIILINPLQCLYFIIFILLLQQLDGNVIGPKILGNSTGLSAFWVVFAILIGGGLFGVGGMLFGVPVFAVIYQIVSEIVDNRLKKKALVLDAGGYPCDSGTVDDQPDCDKAEDDNTDSVPDILSDKTDKGE